MKLDKANKRDKKLHKAKHGMRTGSKSVFIIQETLIKRGKKKESK